MQPTQAEPPIFRELFSSSATTKKQGADKKRKNKIKVKNNKTRSRILDSKKFYMGFFLLEMRAASSSFF